MKATATHSARVQAQRERIMGAAESCFFQHGFHAATMDAIARAADMSPGLIYRYFDNKQDLVRAIIDRQLSEARDDIRRLSSSADMVAGIVDAFEQWKSENARAMNSALFLEMTAETARDRDIATAVRGADEFVRQELHAFLRRNQRGSGARAQRDTRARLVILQSLIEGLVIRAIREPTLDRQTLRAALEKFIPQLVSGMQGVDPTSFARSTRARVARRRGLPRGPLASA
jgi:AcrR family transcriptional regulator